MKKTNRREKGEGSVFLRSDGRYVAQVQNGTKPNGRPNYITRYAKTEALAKKKLKELKLEIASNTYIANSKKTVQQYMTDWLNTVKVLELRPGSFDRLEETLLYQVFPYIGHIQNQAVTSDDVQKMITELYKKGYAESTIKKAKQAVNNCYSTGVIKHTARINPALGVVLKSDNKNVKNKAKKKPKIHYYLPEEINKIEKAVLATYRNKKQIYRLGYAVVLVLNTGIRISELVGLKRSNVNLDKKYISIEDTIVVIKNRDKSINKKYIMLDQEDTTKSISGGRKIHLNDKAYTAVLKLLELSMNGTYLLETKQGKPVSPRNLDTMLRNALDRAGFEENRLFGFHALRHTFASMLFFKKIDVRVISELLGHVDTKITEDTYIHLIDLQKENAVNQVVNF